MTQSLLLSQQKTSFTTREELIRRAEHIDEVLSRERKAMMFYLSRSLEINYRDNFETIDAVRLDGETVRAWRAGKACITDRQLYSYFDRHGT